jgi:phosphoglycolate phosphatase
MNLKRPKAAFFDWDGTLVDSFTFLHKAHNHAQLTLGIPQTSLDEFHVYFGRSREILYRDMYGDKAEEARKHFETFVRGNHLKDLQPMDGAEELLRTLKKLSIPAGLVSNKKGDFIRAEVTNFGWDDYFVSIVGAAEAAQDKPSAAPLLLAIEKANITENRNDIWYVGDTETDLACAKEAGCPSVLVETSHEAVDYSGKYSPVLVVKNCLELNEYLLQTPEN